MSDAIKNAIESALLRVAKNVAKHFIQRDGWHEEDECFRIDLRAAETEIAAAVDVEIARLTTALHAAKSHPDYSYIVKPIDDAFGNVTAEVLTKAGYERCPEVEVAPGDECWRARKKS